MSRSDRELLADAACLRLAAAIEAVANMSSNMRVGAFGEEWPLIWATRNRIAHGYTFIDRGMIEATIDKDLPGFESTLSRLFGELS